MKRTPAEESVDFSWGSKSYCMQIQRPLLPATQRLSKGGDRRAGGSQDPERGRRVSRCGEAAARALGLPAVCRRRPLLKPRNRLRARGAAPPARERLRALRAHGRLGGHDALAPRMAQDGQALGALGAADRARALPSARLDAGRLGDRLPRAELVLLAVDRVEAVMWLY